MINETRLNIEYESDNTLVSFDCRSKGSSKKGYFCLENNYLNNNDVYGNPGYVVISFSKTESIDDMIKHLQILKDMMLE